MAISPTLLKYMEDHHCRYDVLGHAHSHSSSASAHAARVPEDCMAKPVILEDERGYLMAVVPANRQVDLQMLQRATGRELRLVPEYTFGRLFRDCELGAMPPVGSAYGIPMMIDESLRAQREVYFEAGDHEELIQMDAEQFCMMMESAGFASFCTTH